MKNSSGKDIFTLKENGVDKAFVRHYIEVLQNLGLEGNAEPSSDTLDDDDDDSNDSDSSESDRHASRGMYLLPLEMSSPFSHLLLAMKHSRLPR